MVSKASDLLLKAYAKGIFPMSDSRSSDNIKWFSPNKRGIIPLDSFHIPRRLKKTIRNNPYKILVDTSFEKVIKECAKKNPGRTETWINDTIIEMYIDLFNDGYAHSVECWENNELVGGLYGISLGAAFFGESMFSVKRDASKIALVYLIARMQYGGFNLLDTQFITNHLEGFGASEIDRAEYIKRLEFAINGSVNFYGLAADTPPVDVLDIAQSNAHTS